MSDASDSFCTAVTCMDGRIQDSVAAFLRERFGARWVDTVTEAGPVGALAEGNPQTVKSVQFRVGISVEKHASSGIAVVAHEGCAAVPGGQAEQTPLALASAERLRKAFPGMGVVTLWAGLDGSIAVLD